VNISAHVNFLELLGWEGDELNAFLPDWMNAAKFLGLTEEDVSLAVKKWIPSYWDLSLKGIRMFIAACIREIVEISKARQYMESGDKTLYFNMPAAPVCMYANKLAGNGRLHIAYPGYMMIMVLGAFFNKGLRLCVNANSIDSNCRYCGMCNMRVKAVCAGVVQPPTISWSWGLKCSEGPKTDEMLNCMHEGKWKNVFLTIPHNATLGVVEADDRKRINYLSKKLRLAQQEVSQETGIEVTDEHLHVAMDEYIAYMQRVERLTDMVMKADPLPMTGNEMTLLGLGADQCFDIGYSFMNDALDTVIDEVHERIAKGEGVLPKASPRLASQFNYLCTPWIDKAFRENGVCLALGRVFPFASTFQKYIGEESDIYCTIARMCLATPSSMNMLDEARINAELLNRYKMDGALYGYYSFDKWVGGIQKIMIRLIENKTGVPHFYLEGNLWDSADEAAEDRMTIIRSICNYLKISKIQSKVVELK
jgi:benzoyl-CoA reductase/2-hydroxyglutaryl-CoA dehydratase subunit BcrC/BadD/HgdB